MISLIPEPQISSRHTVISELEQIKWRESSIQIKGNICQLDTPENICRNPASDYVRSFVLANIRLKVDSLSRYAEMVRDV